MMILNVNDDEAIRYSVTKMLTSGGYQVLEATTGSEALEVARKGVALVVLDVKLPDINGFEVCKLLKADPVTSNALVVHLSATYAESQNKVQGLEGGADAYLVCPVEPAELIATVRALLRLRHAEEAARRAARDWQRTFDAIGDAVCMVDGKGRIVSANRSMTMLFPNALREHFDAVMERALLVPSPEPLARLRQLDKHEVLELELKGRWVRVSADPVFDERGNVQGGVRVVADISSVKLLEQQLRQRADDLALADQRKDEFLAMLAHELRNPLAAISVTTQLAEANRDSERGAEWMGMVLRQTRHLGRLVEDLLEASRLSQGKLQVRKEPVDLTAIVRHAAETCDGPVKKKRLDLSLSLPKEPFFVLGDNTRLEQVVCNLLDNATKYTPEKGEIRVQLTSVAAGGRPEVRLTVADTGIGIAQDMLNRVFELFAQVDESLDRTRGGLGVGLTLARRIIELHDGFLEAHSDGLGKGSRFVVRIPQMMEQAATMMLSPPATQSAARARRVLLVEDNADTRESLQELISFWGHECDAAADGDEAVEKASTLKPDIALVDVGLPGKDGYQVAREIRQGPLGKGVYLVALTGYGGPEHRNQALDAGFDLHLVKPVDPTKLRELLAKDLGLPSAAAS